MESEILVLINKVAKIVHDTAISWSGNPYMNLDGGFLLSWKLPLATNESSYEE